MIGVRAPAGRRGSRRRVGSREMGSGIGRRVGGRFRVVIRVEVENINVGVVKQSRRLGNGLGWRDMLLIVASDS